MADQFSEAPDVETIGNKLIKKHHDHLSTRRVEFLFIERLDKDGNSQAIVTKGKNLYGKAKLITGLNAFLAGMHAGNETPFFVIVITKHFWTNASQEFKHALVDHELSHCWYDSEIDKYSLMDHDVTEFTAIVKRHGLWHHDLDMFFKAAKQQSLQFNEAAEPETKSKRTKLSAVPTAPAQ